MQVKGLEFNTFSPNLLASGAADGELCIWDVANPAQPSLYPALKVPAPLSQNRPLLSSMGRSHDQGCSCYCAILHCSHAGMYQLADDMLALLHAASPASSNMIIWLLLAHVYSSLLLFLTTGKGTCLAWC